MPKAAEHFVGEWTYAGDEYLCDEEGYFHYCGRTDDMFKAGGMWVSPFDVEAALASHEAFLEAAVIGKAGVDGLTKPGAFSVLKNGHAADAELLERRNLHVKERAGPQAPEKSSDLNCVPRSLAALSIGAASNAINP